MIKSLATLTYIFLKLGGQQRFICTICGKHYTTTYNMRQHKNIHTGAGLHTCRYCGRDFTHKHVWEVSTSNTNTYSDIILLQLK